MKKPRKVLAADHADSPWKAYLEEFFEETPTSFDFLHDAREVNLRLDQMRHDVVFIAPGLVSPALFQKLKILHQSSPDFRLFALGESPKKSELPFDEAFDKPPDIVEFQKRLTHALPLAETIRVLVVDDEKEIGEMVKEFLADRVHPSFTVAYAENGARGLEALLKEAPDVLVMDIKMPVMDGRELYREIKKRKIETPVIIFFDSISGDEMIEIHKYGRPTVVEKGARQAALPEMMGLIKKMAYFG